MCQQKIHSQNLPESDIESDIERTETRAFYTIGFHV